MRKAEWFSAWRIWSVRCPRRGRWAPTMSPAQIRQLVTAVALRMRAAGVTMDLAPVLDLDNGVGPNNRDPDGTRSFSLNPSIAAADGVAFLQGLEAGGVIPVVKHFPGLGQASGNTDVAPATTQPWTALQHAGLVPFESAFAAGAPVVMIANATVPGLSTLPASISPVVMTTVLRDQLGFQRPGDHRLALGRRARRYRLLGSRGGGGRDQRRRGHGPVHGRSRPGGVAHQRNRGGTGRGRQRRDARPRRLISAVANILTAKHVDLCAG